jgi:hypothetical protein
LRPHDTLQEGDSRILHCFAEDIPRLRLTEIRQATFFSRSERI